MRPSVVRAAVFLATLSSLCAFAGQLPATSLTDSPAFSSPTEAALAALRLVSSPCGKVERGGVILRRGDSFYYTDPVPGDEDKIDFRLMKPVGYSVAGTYHTHPVWGLPRDGYWQAEAFSGGDMDVANKLRALSFVFIESTRQVLAYDPSLPLDHRMRSENRYVGTVVGSL